MNPTLLAELIQLGVQFGLPAIEDMIALIKKNPGKTAEEILASAAAEEQDGLANDAQVEGNTVK